MVATKDTPGISYYDDRCRDFGVRTEWGLVPSGVEFDSAVLELVQHHYADIDLSRLCRAAAQAKGRAPAQRRTCRRFLEWRISLALNPGHFDERTPDRGATAR